MPNALLTPYVEIYWSCDGFAGEEESLRILPDGCVDIIFTLDRVVERFDTDIVGTMTSFLEVSYPQSVQTFGIRFKPAGITAFTRVPVEEFTGRSVELASAETLFDRSFYETLPEKRSAEEIIAHVDNYLINRIPYLYHADGQILHAVDLICFAKGQSPLAAVASDVCLCQRHFERRFKSAIGVSPKTFANIIRFKHALRRLRSQPDCDLLSVAIECGYYDHTHLIREFGRLAGSTPGSLR